MALADLMPGDIHYVMKLHEAMTRRVCWEHSESTARDVQIVVHIDVGRDGKVLEAVASGNDASVGKCLEGEVLGWVFPPFGGGRFDLPFHFVR